MEGYIYPGTPWEVHDLSCVERDGDFLWTVTSLGHFFQNGWITPKSWQKNQFLSYSNNFLLSADF